jgi:hypothetical protein
MKNYKRANVSITLLVFIALFLVGFALFSFAIHPNIESRVADARFIEKGFQKEQMFKEKMFIEGSLRSEKEFYDKTRNYPFSEMKMDDFEINESSNLRIAKLNVIGSIVKISLNDSLYFLEIYGGPKNEIYLDYLYRPNPVVEINLTSLGLASFDNINIAVNECKGKGNDNSIVWCLNDKLNNFESKIVLDGLKRKIEFITKKEFLIDGSLEKISFNIPI